MNVLFRFDTNRFNDTGFGSVFEDVDDFGQLGNLSTQAILSFIKNVPEGGLIGGEVVGIGEHELEEFHIPRTETLFSDADISIGK